jgi:hypothetical protein
MFTPHPQVVIAKLSVTQVALLGVLGAERADSLASAPDLKVVNLLELLVVLLTVVGL